MPVDSSNGDKSGTRLVEPLSNTCQGCINNNIVLDPKVVLDSLPEGMFPGHLPPQTIVEPCAFLVALLHQSAIFLTCQRPCPTVKKKKNILDFASAQEYRRLAGLIFGYQQH